MIKPYKVILVDLDGTLTDPKIGITKSVKYALLKLGVEEDDSTKFVKFIGFPLLESFKKYYPFDDAKGKKAVGFYREYYAKQGIFEATLYPHIPNFLMQLYESNKVVILATLKPTIYTEQILKHFDLHKWFTSIKGSNLDLTLTHKDEIIQHIISNVQDYHRNEMVMIGDRVGDIIGAKKNGIDSIAVTYGYGSRGELEQANPTYIVHSVEELKSLFV